LALLLAGLLAHLLLILLAGALLSRTLLARLPVVVRHFHSSWSVQHQLFAAIDRSSW